MGLLFRVTPAGMWPRVTFVFSEPRPPHVPREPCRVVLKAGHPLLGTCQLVVPSRTTGAGKDLPEGQLSSAVEKWGSRLKTPRGRAGLGLGVPGVGA